MPLFAGLLWLAGCSSTPTQVDTGPIHARTFSFIQRTQKASPGFANENEDLHKMIHEAIVKNLGSRGVTNVEAGGNVLVAYMVIVGNNVSTTAINDYFGYGRNAVELQEKAQDAYTSSKSPNAFQAGTLVIDIIDPTTLKLLKRGYTVRPILRNQAAEARAERIQEAVDQILQDLRVAP
jgi:hypothetical protein